MHSNGAGAPPRGPGDTSPTGSRRRRRPSCSTSVTSCPSTSTPTCSVSSSPAQRARRVSRRTSTSTSPERRSETRTGASSIAGRASPSREPTGSSAATSATRSRGSRSSTAFANRASLHTCCTVTRGRPSSSGPYDGIVTSPPYPGLIDYHEQHRYAYELLGLDDRRERELGAAARGTSRAAIAEYADGIVQVLRRCAGSLAPGAPVVVVVNDRRDLYPEILVRRGARRRAAPRAPRQPAHGSPCWRVLRVDLRRAQVGRLSCRPLPLLLSLPLAVSES